MRQYRSHLYHVSPWLLAAATGLLVLIVVTFAVSNLQREKRQMTKAMLQKADTIVRLVKSSSRASYMANLRDDSWNLSPWNEHVQKVIDHLAEDPDIDHILLLNQNGEIIAHNNKQLVGSIIEFNPPNYSSHTGTQDNSSNNRIVITEDKQKVFEVIHPYIPYRSHMERMLLNPWMGMRHNFSMMGKNEIQGQNTYQFSDEPDPDLQYYLIVGLDMRDFDRSLIRLRIQILVLSLTMLLVGLGGWFSLAAVQGYKVSQQTLSEIKAFTGHLIAKLPVGIIATNQKGRITTWNKVASELTGVSGKKATGKMPRDVLPQELKDFFIERKEQGTARFNENGKKKEILISINGHEYILFCTLIDILDFESEYLGQVLLLSNLTELKKLEKEMRENERLAAVGRMAAGVAHEVRNPLSSIKGLALLLKEKFTSQSKENETAKLLIQEVERMNRTISELLSFARPAPLKLQRVDLEKLLLEELKLIEPDTKNNNIVTTSFIDKGLEKIMADRDRLKQVFINILLNAVQAMEKGGELKVSAKNVEDGNFVEVKISDTGKGIDASSLDQVFFPYFTTKHGGTGIGLAISQKIISDHNGSIRINSIQGQGTIVSVLLPVSKNK